MLKHRLTYFLVVLSVVFLNLNTASAQSGGLFKKNQEYYTTVGIGGGSSHYFGDLSPYRKFYYALYSNVRWNGTINYQYNINEKIGARIGFSYVRIFGNDMSYGGAIADNAVKGQRIRNLHFRNDLMEFAVTGIYNFIPLEKRNNKNQPLQWSPYIGLGVGIIGHNPQARGRIQDTDGSIIPKPDDNNKIRVREWTNLKPEYNENQNDGIIKPYSSVTPVFPLILGIKARLNHNLILSVEGGLRISLTDYLDDVGANPYSTTSLLSYRADEDYNAYSGKSRVEQFRKAVGQTGDVYPSVLARSELDITKNRGSSMIDSYVVTQITLNYIISSGVKCPPLKY